MPGLDRRLDKPPCPSCAGRRSANPTTGHLPRSRGGRATQGPRGALTHAITPGRRPAPDRQKTAPRPTSAARKRTLSWTCAYGPGKEHLPAAGAPDHPQRALGRQAPRPLLQLFQSRTLEWRPEYSVSVVEAAGHGNTVVDAASAALLLTNGHAGRRHAGRGVPPDGRPGRRPAELLRILDDRAARSPTSCICRLIPALARAHRCSDVRRTGTPAAWPEWLRASWLSDARSAAAAGVAGDVAVRAQERAVDEVRASSRCWTRTPCGCGGTPSAAHSPGTACPASWPGPDRLLWTAESSRAGEPAAGHGRTVLGDDPGEQAGWIGRFLAGNALLLIRPAPVGHHRPLGGRHPSRAFIDALPALRRAPSARGRGQNTENSPPESPDLRRDPTAGRRDRQARAGGAEKRGRGPGENGSSVADGPEAAAPETRTSASPGPSSDRQRDPGGRR